MHFYNNFRKECLRHGRFDMTPYQMGISMDISMDIHEKNPKIHMLDA